jgi:hypothetical protein
LQTANEQIVIVGAELTGIGQQPKNGDLRRAHHPASGIDAVAFDQG